jgi:hypothetical protein
VFTDFVVNGEGHGSVGSALQEVRFEPGLLRQFRDKKGRQLCTINTGEFDENGKPVRRTFETRQLRAMGVDVPFVSNATTMTQDWYLRTETAVVKATRERLRAWTDLAGASSVGGFNGMGTLQYQYNAATDPGEAVVDMDAVVDARNDTPLFKLRAVPLPITHSDFMYTERQLAASRNGGGMAFDTSMAEAAARRVAEMVEKTLIGVETGMTFGTRSGDALTAHDGTSTVYGYTNFPSRVTKTDLTSPTGSNPEAVMTDILEMVETMQTNGFYGPYMLYTSTGYSRFLNDDYFRSGSTSAVRRSASWRSRASRTSAGWTT